VNTTYLQDFERFTQNGGGKPQWLAGLRQAAIDRFATQGFPPARDEDWRFTNIAPITNGAFRLAGVHAPGRTTPDVRRFVYDLPGSPILVFINGRFVESLSTTSHVPAGVRIKNLASALTTEIPLLDRHLGKYASYERNGFTALNTAFVKDGVFIYISAGVELTAPIQVIFAIDAGADSVAIHPRNLIVVEAGARVSVIESYVSLSDQVSFTNAVTEAVVGQGARLEHTKIQRESELAYHVGTTHVSQGRDSRVWSHSVSLGAALCRNNLDVTLDGPGTESQLFGLYMGHGRQEVDNHTSILHAHPNCSTREIYKGVLDGASHAVFNGKVYVTPEAQKTDAKQTNRNLLLSDRAKVDTKPQLEIFADDVKCTHGATVGNLDALAGFYLKSRGIGPALGRKILTYAFAAEVLEEIPYEAVRRELETVVMARLEQREG
jgi:Fe-S cluster assembly protein SufD